VIYRIVPFPVTLSDSNLDFKVMIFFNFKYVETAKRILKLFSASSGSPTILVFAYEILWRNSDRMKVGYEKIASFYHYLAFSTRVRS